MNGNTIIYKTVESRWRKWHWHWHWHWHWALWTTVQLVTVTVILRRVLRHMFWYRGHYATTVTGSFDLQQWKWNPANDSAKHILLCTYVCACVRALHETNVVSTSSMSGVNAAVNKHNVPLHTYARARTFSPTIEHEHKIKYEIYISLILKSLWVAFRLYHLLQRKIDSEKALISIKPRSGLT